jgi:hypothetical protein
MLVRVGYRLHMCVRAHTDLCHKLSMCIVIQHAVGGALHTHSRIHIRTHTNTHTRIHMHTQHTQSYL